MTAESFGRSIEPTNGEVQLGTAYGGAESVMTNSTKRSTNTMDLSTIPNPFMEMINTLELHDWKTGTLGDAQNGFCTAGAYGYLCALNPEMYDHPEVRIRMTNIFMKHLPKGDTIFSFNDRTARDFADVREILKHCAQDWDEALQ